MRGNLESKFIAEGTKPLELGGGQVGSEKHKNIKKEKKYVFKSNCYSMDTYNSRPKAAVPIQILRIGFPGLFKTVALS